MIIPMKKLTILTLKKYETNTLNELRDLGVVHLNSHVLKTTDARDRIDAVSHLAALDKLIGALEQFSLAKEDVSSVDGKKLAIEAEALLNEQEKLSQELEALNKSITDLQGWGEFNFDELETFHRQGLRLYLCTVPSDDRLKEFRKNEDYNCIELNRSKHGINFVLVTDKKLDKAKLPLANLNTTQSLSMLVKKQKEASKMFELNRRHLFEIANKVDGIKSYKASLAEEVEFLTARDAMEQNGEITYIDGFVPVTEIKCIEEAAKNHAWGFLAEDADKNEVVPTLLKMPKWVKVITPLFDFLAINPGYNELDVSGAVTIFFSIFFGILIGDAGYGALFFIASLAGLIATKKSNPKRSVFRLILMLSFFAMTWGVLTGNYFGMQGPGLPHFTEEAVKDSNTQLVCFVLGVLQLSLGHFWRAVVNMHWRNVGAQLGWVCVMVGNFILITKMLVNPGPYPDLMMYCYGVGIFLVALCEVNWVDAGSVFGFPFSIVNSFVDLLSYIRLFAVGLAGFYLAYSFNLMAKDVMDGSALGLCGGILILFLGHSLNMGLAVLSVLVHGVRLNTLEFSSHIGLQWTGFAYKPFKKNS